MDKLSFIITMVICGKLYTELEKYIKENYGENTFETHMCKSLSITSYGLSAVGSVIKLGKFISENKRI